MDPAPMTSTTEPTRPTPRGRRIGLRRFRRDDSGATMVEFAMVATPFFALMGAICEMAMLFFTTQVLEEAVFQTSRTLLTGRSYERYTGTPAANADRFRQDVCARAPVLVDCSRLSIDVKAYNSFDNAGTGTTSPVRGAGNALDTSGFGFTQPQPKQIVVVRAVLRYPVYMAGFSNALINVGGGEHAVIATTAFRAEPFNPPTS